MFVRTSTRSPQTRQAKARGALWAIPGPAGATCGNGSPDYTGGGRRRTARGVMCGPVERSEGADSMLVHRAISRRALLRAALISGAALAVLGLGLAEQCRETPHQYERLVDLN